MRADSNDILLHEPAAARLLDAAALRSLGTAAGRCLSERPYLAVFHELRRFVGLFLSRLARCRLFFRSQLVLSHVRFLIGDGIVRSARSSSAPKPPETGDRGPTRDLPCVHGFATHDAASGR